MKLATSDQGLPYRDPRLPAHRRVDDLLSRMTLEEKVAQLGSAWVFQLIEGRRLSASRAGDLLRNGLGHVTRISGASSLDASEAAGVANEIQRFLVEQTRLGIPAIVHEEICSGLMARDSVVYPQAIGVASTWEPSLAREMAAAVGRQMRAMGAHQGLSPVLDVARDPRWGRTEETFGEDPYLVARMGTALVEGLQGPDLTRGVAATAKHFVGYSASEGGLNWAPPHIASRELHEVYLYPFRAAVEAGAASVMNGYHELDGVPCAADEELLTGILRDQWGFEGTVVSDYFSIRQLAAYHHVADSAAEAAALALRSGVDVELPGTDCYGTPLLQAIESGAVEIGMVDEAVRRVLRSKFELGLFEAPFVDVKGAGAISTKTADRDLARLIAMKSLVLLSNSGVLPISPVAGSVAVIGPNADDPRNLFGDYTYPAHIEALAELAENNVFSVPFAGEIDLDAAKRQHPTVLEALRGALGDRVAYARGCEVNSAERSGIEEALALARRSDLAVMIMGDKAGLTEDCTSGEGRDRSSLDLPGVQEELVRAVIETGVPVVLVLVSGRPIGSPWIHEHSAAVLQAWLPGEEGAAAIAAALTGSANPGGKLPISHPRSVGQIPIYYGHKVSGGRSHWKGAYVDGPATPLYPFGYGLSYTTFTVSGLSVAPDLVTRGDDVVVTATVANTGARDGDEVIQLYVRDPVASVTRPVLELKGFARVDVPANASREITFRLPVAECGFYDSDLVYVLEPGSLEFLVGTSSQDLEPAGSVDVVPDGPGLAPGKRLDRSAEIGSVEIGPVVRSPGRRPSTSTYPPM